jgi:hypothetical protein
MIKPRRLLIGSAVALGVTLPPAIAMLFWDDQPANRLPNGAVMRLTTIQYGKPRPIVYGPVWKRRLFPLASFLPVDVSRRISWITLDPSKLAAPNALTLGLAYYGHTSQHPRGELVDSHGCRYESPINLLGPSDGGSSKIAVFPFFPRRQASFQLETYLQERERTPTGAFTLPNPAGTRHPIWEPAQLPATQLDGPLEVTLLAAERGWLPGYQGRVRASDLPFTKLSYRLGNRSWDWAPVGATLRDATGGSYRFDFQDWRRASSALFVRGDNLCREEPAYEYRVEFSRAPVASTRPDRVYDLGAVATAKPAIVVLPDGHAVAGFANPRGNPTISGSWYPREGELGRLWATAADGRPLPPTPFQPRWGRSREQTLKVIVPKGAKRVHLHFGIYKSRFVTFRVKPRWLSPPGS